ncbi:helix-turn-helix domain-containing protein [Streptomyces brasiliscabiei]
MVGYNNVENFIRTFKRQTGMTPSQYRRTHNTYA